MLEALVFLLAIAGGSHDCNAARKDVMPEKVALENWSDGVCAVLADEYQNIHIDVLRVIEKGEAGSGSSRGKISIESVRAGRAKIVWQSNDGNFNVTFFTKIKGEKNTWVFKKSLSPGTEIKRRHIRKEMKDVLRYSGLKEIVSYVPVGRVTSKRVDRSQVITADLVKHQALVEKNERVDIVVLNNGIRIRAKGKALTTGWNLDDKIQVFVNQSSEAIEAFVMGEKLVYVQN